MVGEDVATAATDTPAGEIRRGFLATVPLWAGLIPFSMAMGVLARAAGFSVVETQALSLLVFAGGAQIAIVTLFAGGAGAVPIVATALVLNLRHILYGLSLGRLWARPVRPPAPLVAMFLVDESYGLTIRDRLAGGGGPGFLLGSGLSLYVSYNIATLIGALVGQFLADPRRLGLDFIFPLTFVALLVPLLRGWRQCAVAAIAAATVILIGRVAPGGVAVVGAAVVAAGVGTALDRVGTPAPEQG